MGKNKDKLTIRKLYEMAKERGEEDAQIFLDYKCDDDWYNFDEKIHKENIEFRSCKIIINIDNYNY